MIIIRLIRIFIFLINNSYISYQV